MLLSNNPKMVSTGFDLSPQSCSCITSGQTSKTDTIIKAVVIVLTIIVTIGAMWYIYNLMNKAKPAVIYERRQAR